ncbi:MAG: alpha/beta hydrolase [Polyangiales bacterium]
MKLDRAFGRGHKVTSGYIMDASFIDRGRFLFSPSGRSSWAPYSFVDVGKASLRVSDRGAGAVAFVVTPDPPNVLEHHETALVSLAQHGRAVGVELPGFGHSRPAPSFAFSVDENTDVLLGALEKLEVERAVLVFPCLAGLVALEAARRAPARIAAVILSQTPSFQDALSWSERVDFRGLIGTPIVGQVLVRALRGLLARAWYRAALPAGVDQTAYLEQALAAYGRGADYSLASALQAVRRARPPSETVPVPVLSIWGDADRTHRQSDPNGGVALAPRHKVVIFEGSGHFPDLEQPERFEREVLQFIRAEIS